MPPLKESRHSRSQTASMTIWTRPVRPLKEQSWVPITIPTTTWYVSYQHCEYIFAYNYMQLLVPNAAVQGMIPPFPLSNGIYDDLDAAGVATRGTILRPNNHTYNDLVCVLRVL
jgi:hypothetical protein